MLFRSSVRAVAKKLNLNKRQFAAPEPKSYADIGVLDESFDEQELPNVGFRSRLKTLRNRPFLFGLALTVLITVFAARNRFGALSGGAMPIATGGARDLINKFGQSWHPVAMGSASPTPNWLGISGIASSLTLGNVSLFFTLLYFLAPIIAFIAMYRASKRMGLTVFTASIAGFIYTMSPAVWNSVNQGRLGTLVAALLIPTFLSLNPFKVTPEISWRRTYGIVLLTGFIGAFSPLLLIFWTLYWLVSLALDFYQRRTEINQKKLLTFFATAYLAVEKRKSAFLLLPIALNFPWSASLIFHPTQILLDPGLPLSGGEGTWLALFNPGGESGVPLWIVSPIIFYLITVLFSKKYVMDGVISALLLSSVIILSIFNVVGHGSDGRFWAGSILIDRKSTRLNSSHVALSRMPSSA